MPHNLTMNTLYDSDTFSVTHMHADVPGALEASSLTKPTSDSRVLIRHGFEIVDKRNGKEIYLDGSWAELFKQKITAWQLRTPTQEEVEDTLEGYASLAQNPVLVH